MKLLQLSIENYGHFREHSIDFNSSFSLVFGPNEAGKSTLLQLIREQLFGFKHINPYAFATDSKTKLAAIAEIELADGQRLRFRRQKGKPDVVKGEVSASGQAVDANMLTRWLGNMTRQRYEHLFGFSLHELTAGQESLNEANIGEALYGGSLGSLSGFQHVRAALQSEADALLTERGRKKIIDGILSEIKDRSKALRNAEVKPAKYKQLIDACKLAAARVDATRQRAAELKTKVEHLDRINRALEPWSRHQHALQEISQLDVPNDFPLDGADQLSRLKKRRAELEEAQADIDSELQAECSELAALQLAPEVVAEEARIRLLQQQIKQVESCRSDTAKLGQEAESIRADVAARLRRLHPQWDLTNLDQFESTLVQREMIERLKREREQLDRERSELAGEQRATESNLESLQNQLAKIESNDSIDDFAALSEGSPKYHLDQERCDEQREAIAEQQERIEAIITRLCAPLGNAAIDENLPVPMAATVVEFRDRWKQSADDLREAERQVVRTERELADKQIELEQLDANSSVPDREQLVARREQRDAGWQLIRQRFIDQKKVTDKTLQDWLAGTDADDTANIPTAISEAYEKTVSAADRMADQRQEKSELAAKRDGLIDEIQRLARRLDSDSKVVAKQQEQRTNEASNWSDVWKACTFDPLSPSAMLDWLQDYEMFVEAHKQLRVLKRKHEQATTDVAGFEARLTEAFPNEHVAPDVLLSRAKQLVKAADEAATERRTIDKQLAEKEHAAQSIKKSLAELDKRDSDWQARWQKLLDEFSFPHDWDVHVAAKILEGLAEARGEVDRAIALDERISGMNTTIGDFESGVRELVNSIAVDLSEFQAEHAINALFDRLEIAKRAHDSHDRLQRSSAKHERQLTDVKAKLDETQRDITSLFKAAHTESEKDFMEVAEAAKRLADFCRIRDESAREINTIRGNEDAELFELALQSADHHEVASQQQELAHELKRAEDDAEAALKEHVLRDKERVDLERGSQAAELAQDLESSRGKLVAAVDRWIPLVLAQAVMRRAIEKFQREHQPAVMSDVGNLLKQMTVGRYVGIERKLDEQGTLQVVDDRGGHKEPQHLSRGTREQLYLAIRLAYIKHYCHDAEPLPIVMDDVLVNFDAERRKQTLEVLTRLAESVQVIFLTCDERMPELLQDISPRSEPIILPGGTMPEGFVSASREKRPSDVPSVT